MPLLQRVSVCPPPPPPRYANPAPRRDLRRNRFEGVLSSRVLRHTAVYDSVQDDATEAHASTSTTLGSISAPGM